MTRAGLTARSERRITLAHFAGLSIRQLASVWGVSRGTVSNIIAAFRERTGLNALEPNLSMMPCATCGLPLAGKNLAPPVFCADCTSQLLAAKGNHARRHKEE